VTKKVVADRGEALDEKGGAKRKGGWGAGAGERLDRTSSHRALGGPSFYDSFYVMKAVGRVSSAIVTCVA
jgi:hypothetical protein